MKLSKNLGRIATTFLATAMLAAFAAVPASAENLGTDGTISGSTTSAISEIVIPVTVYKPLMGYTPDVELKITVNNAADAEGGNETIEVNGGADTVDVHNGIGAETIKVTPAGGSEGGNVAFSSANDGIGGSGSGSSTISKNVAFDVSALTGFTTPGVYKYTIHTVVMSGDSDDFTEATDLPMYLFVANDSGKYVVTGVVVKKSDKSAKAKEIANYYMVDPTDPENPDNQSVADLTIKNNVSGAMGDYNEDFTYTLDITTGKSYHAVKTNAQQGKEPMELKAGQNTFTLKHGESIVIYSLEKDIPFNLKENGATMGYTVTYSESGYTDEDGVNISLADGNKEVTFNNERNAITPTGLVMNVAPYVLLVLVAAGAGYVFLRKREED